MHKKTHGKKIRQKKQKKEVLRPQPCGFKRCRGVVSPGEQELVGDLVERSRSGESFRRVLDLKDGQGVTVCYWCFHNRFPKQKKKRRERKDD